MAVGLEEYQGFHVGDKVTVQARQNYDRSKYLASFVNEKTYEIIQIGGPTSPDDRIVIGINGQVTAAVKASEITNISNSAKEVPKEEPVVEETPTEEITYEEDAMSSEGIEDAMTALLSAGNSDEMLKYNMRLFGVPHQFTNYCDFRTYSVSGKSPDALIGRKFIENMFLEAPVITIIPGKPLYLPAAKNKKGISHAILTAANNNVAELFQALDEENMNEKLRYYDFQQDYFKYMEYVNILCAVAAAFLDLENYVIPFASKKLTQYKWQNYRWNNDGYKNAFASAMAGSKSLMENMINSLKTYGENVLNALSSVSGDEKSTDETTSDTVVDALEEPEDDNETFLEVLETIMTNCNFVQFYIDSKSGMNESSTNATSQSKIQGMVESGQELLKEVAFLANSGGIDSAALQEVMAGGMDEINSRLFSGTGAISGVLSRLTSVGTNIIKGDNMIFPEIYQSSAYSKSYSITIDLVAPYGNRLSYYLNVLVPLFHLICLAVPRQQTANTYGSPFLVKAYYPGTFSCNLGIVDSLQIDKNPDGDAWSVDGFPTHVRVTLNIKDLYSDLTITPTGDVFLFLANSSLIEYIATNCGINLITPQLVKRAKMITSVAKAVISDIPGNVENIVFGGLDNLISSMAGV